MKGCITKKGSTYSIIVDMGRDEKGKRKQKWLMASKLKNKLNQNL